jgi:hypothetical protein
MSSSPDEESVIENWRLVLPESVPQFELIIRSVPLLSGDDAFSEENEEEDIETFPCECRYDPSIRMYFIFYVDFNREECACGPLSKCVNRELLIECAPDECPAGAYCQNRRFQKFQYATVEVITCGPKGHGLKTLEDLKG